MQLQSSYFTAYHNLKLTRAARGSLATAPISTSTCIIAASQRPTSPKAPGRIQTVIQGVL